MSCAAPELGPLASVMMGTECGSWQVDEVMVVSSRTHHTDRFVCRECLGSKGTSAAFLTPVPPGAVVYGSGESATILTKVPPHPYLTTHLACKFCSRFFSICDILQQVLASLLLISPACEYYRRTLDIQGRRSSVWRMIPSCITLSAFAGKDAVAPVLLP
jgi:hypothetical protein